MTNSINFTTQDLAPLYRNSIGVDKLFENLFARNRSFDNTGNYPPYNIVAVTDDHYIIELALAGFNKEDINLTVHNGQLIIKGEKAAEEADVRYLHQGIGARKFKRTFELADYVEVQDADMVNGILVINLERIIPDSAKPKKIRIGTNLEPVSIDDSIKELLIDTGESDLQ